MSYLTNHSAIKATNHSINIDPTAFVVRKGERLFNMGDQLEGIFVVNSGVVKLSRISESGDEQIILFAMPGDFLGLDALSDGISHSTATVLDICNISLVPFNKLLDGGSDFDYANFIHKIGVTLNRENDHSMMLSKCTAEQRIAWFLTEFSDGLASRGLVAHKFNLPMTRTEIALFLGLAVETVSRELTRFCKMGLINKNLHHIELIELDSLLSIVHGYNASKLPPCQPSKHNRSYINAAVH